MNTSRSLPLNALRAFEAVARLRSFRKAAEELFVTPAAVTHQIKALEDHLGVKLFHRLPRGVELTPAAQAALPVLQRGFQLLARGVNELREHGRKPRLTVRMTPTFASRWLMPRLQNFLSANEGIDVRVLASSSPDRAQRMTEDRESVGEPDINIVFSDRPAGLHVDLLFAVNIVPMCHPRLLRQGPHPLKTPADLQYHTLLHGDTHIEDRTQSAWGQWLRAAGATQVDPRRGLQFDHSTLALDAAADGLGVTLATPLFARDELARGDVAIAFPLAIPLDRAYFAVTAPASAHRPEVAAFRQWLLHEAALDARRAQRSTQKKRAAGAAPKNDP